MIRVAIRGAGIAYPCILGEPFVCYATQWTKRAAEKYWRRVKGLAVNLDTGRNGSPCLGAEDHHHTH